MVIYYVTIRILLPYIYIKLSELKIRKIDWPDHWDDVEVYIPNVHEAEDTDLDGDDGENDPDGGQRVGDQNEGNGEHDHSPGNQAAHCWRHNADKL